VALMALAFDGRTEGLDAERSQESCCVIDHSIGIRRYGRTESDSNDRAGLRHPYLLIIDGAPF
jgi:hypothetical protein